MNERFTSRFRKQLTDVITKKILSDLYDKYHEIVDNLVFQSNSGQHHYYYRGESFLMRGAPAKYYENPNAIIGSRYHDRAEKALELKKELAVASNHISYGIGFALIRCKTFGDIYAVLPTQIHDSLDEVSTDKGTMAELRDELSLSEEEIESIKDQAAYNYFSAKLLGMLLLASANKA